MTIRTRLSLYFTLISCGALLLVLSVLYFAVYTFSREDFFARLTDRANVASQLYLKADEIGADSLIQVQQRYLEKLNGEIIKIYNEDNKAAFNTHNDVFWRDTIIEQVRHDKFLKYQDGRRQVVGKYYHDNQGDFVILVSAIDRNFEERTRRMGKLALGLFVVFSGVLFLAGRLFANKALAPIKKVIGQMAQIRSTNLHMRVKGVKNKDEIAELINNFNSLLERLENAFELQQTFVANASHELRTPLTSIMGEVDVALTKPRSNEEYQIILASVAADGQRLQETISSLMELAQTDLIYTKAIINPVRIDELIWELHDEWSQKQGASVLKIEMPDLPDDEEELNIDGNKALLYLALNNVVNNAFKYGQNKPVTITLHTAGKQISIAVADEGPGITETEKERIFTAFYRGKNVQTKPGTGIGLYITHKIIQLCGGAIHVSTGQPSGTTFTIKFNKTTIH